MLRRWSRWERARALACATMAAVVLLAGPSAASAHGEEPEGVAPMFEGLQFIGGATSFGLVLDEQGTWRWVAAETLDLQVRWQARLADGRVLAGTVGGLRVTEDQGCSWATVPGPLAEPNVTDLAVDPLEPSRLYATTSAGGVDNGVFVSHDGGDTWAALGELRPESFFKRVIVAPGGATLWTAGLEEGTLAPFILRGDAEGSWQPVSAALTDPGGAVLEQLRLFRTGVEPGRFFVAARVDGEDRLLESLDQFESLQQRASFGAAEVTSVGVLDDALFVALDALELWRARGDGAFEPVADGPTECLVPGPDPGELWGCGDLRHGAAFLSTRDGETWTTALPFAEVCPRSCPSSTAGHEINPLVWEPLQTTYGIGTDCPELDAGTDTGTDTGEPSADEPAGGCACALTRDRSPAPAGAALSMFVALMLVSRASPRRRDR